VESLRIIIVVSYSFLGELKIIFRLWHTSGRPTLVGQRGKLKIVIAVTLSMPYNTIAHETTIQKALNMASEKAAVERHKTNQFRYTTYYYIL